MDNYFLKPIKGIIFKHNFKFLLLLLLFQSLLWVSSAYKEKASEDAMWFAEEAYFFANDGYVHSNFFKDFYGRGEKVVSFHRLFVYANAMIVKLFGFHLWTIRLNSYISAVIIMAILFAFVLKKHSIGIAVSTVLFWWLCMENFYAMKIGRPEMMLALMGLISFIFLHKFFISDKLWAAALAGIFAGLSAYVHLNGLIFICAGGCLLLFHKKRFIAISLYSLCIFAVLSHYAYDVFIDWDLYKYQLSSPFYGDKSHLSLIKLAINFFNEQKRYFWDAGSIAVSIILIVSLIIIVYIRSKKQLCISFSDKILFTYTLFIMLFAGLLLHDKRPHYATILYPFFALMVAKSISIFIKKNTTLPKWITILAEISILLFISVGFTGEIHHIVTTEKQNLVRVNQKAAQYMPEGSCCVAPMNFIFEEIADYTIVSLLLANFYVDNKPHFRGYKITPETLYEFCKTRNIDYAVETKYAEKHDRLRFESKEDLVPFFDIIVMNDDFHILKVNNSAPNAFNDECNKIWLKINTPTKSIWISH
ncbi:MAG: hypothetical protein GF401_02905 [Chitinivibrionales bacterium]|nr:hypothetical protein [Chitinivibrionales bacterium]